MSQRDIRTMNMAEGQKIESDDVMKRIGDLSYRNMGALSRAGLFDSGKALIVGTGLRVEPLSGLTVTVPSGAVFQRFVDVIPCVENDSQTVTLDAASGVSRIDIIEAQIKTVTNKDDYSQNATVASGATIAITNELIKRDIKYYLSARKQTNTTTPTAATAGTLTGTVAIATTIDLSEKYLINLSDGEDGSFQEIDCRGATPEATTLVEINAAINAATGRTMATTGGGDVGVLTGNGTGQTSFFTIKPPNTDADKDALQVIYGVSVGGIYKYTYEGTNEWFKIAEIDMGASTTVITSGLIRNIDQKSTWTGEGDETLVKEPVYEYELFSEWAGGKVYSINNIVRKNNTLYLCTSNHTSGTFSTDWITNGYWTPLTTPPGESKMWTATAIPDGYLTEDGSAISRTTYAELFAVISTTYGVGDGSITFNLPDSRGMIKRGTGTNGSEQDAAGNYYAGPSLGSYQGDTMQGHYHVQDIRSPNAGGGGANYIAWTGFNGTGTVQQGILAPLTDGSNGTPRVGSETRMANMATKYIIKY